MIGSGILCLCCYLLAALSASPIIGLGGCVCCGFSVGIMWPGAISVSARSCPKGGTAMFALLALAGDSVRGYVTKATRHPCRVERVIPVLKMVKPGHRGGGITFPRSHKGKRSGVERRHGKLEEAQV